ncbi:MAG: tetratricopeptide repeat protein, partial [Microscillaceae bacterium]|nr:tetratricopeptide repeat protein [Microscillaceae bacterium]MDW8460265.1 tetratricopeptide repeat protein [Cytophagales bacterium]
YEQVFFQLSPQKEKIWIDSMLNDVKNVAKIYANEKANFPTIQKGKFEGQNVLDAMSKITENDLRNFLWYAATHRVYMTTTWKISETYATWIAEGAPIPPTEEELMSILYKANTSESYNLKDAVIDYQEYISNDFLESLESKAQEQKAAKKFTEANAWIDIAIRCATLLDKNSLLGSFYFTKAGIADAEYKVEETAEYYQKAIEYYLNDDNLTMVFVSYINLGETYNSLGRFEKARQSLNKGYQFYQELEKDKLKNNPNLWKVLQPYAGLCLRNLADSYYSMSQYEQALQSYQKALTHFENDKEANQKKLGRKAATYIRIAKVYNQLGQTEKRKQTLQEALKIAQNLEDKSYLAEIYKTMASMYFENREYQLAKEFYLKAKETFTQLNDKSELVYALANLANLANLDNDLKQAENYINQALKIAQEINDEHALSICYRKLANMEMTQGNPKKAQTNLEKALAIAQKSNDKQEEGQILIAIGFSYTTQGNFTKGKEFYQKAQALAQNIKDADLEASAISSLGWLELVAGNYSQAILLYQNVLQIAQKTQNVWAMAGVYHDFGNLYISTGAYQKASEYLEKSDSIYQKVGAKESLLSNQMAAGRLAFFQGDYEKSLITYQKVTEEMKKLGMLGENYCVALGNQADILRVLKRYKEAETIAKEAYQASAKANSNRPKNRAKLLLGGAKLGQKQYTEAEKHLKEAYKNAQAMNLPTDMLAAKNDLSQLYYETKQTDKATQTAQEVIQLSEKIGYELYLWEAYYRLGLIHKEKKDLQKAKEYLQKAVQILEKLRNNLAGGEEAKKLFSNNEAKIKVYGTLIDVLFERQEIEEAMSFMQQYNFAEMQSKLQNQNQQNLNPEQQNKKQRTEQLKTELIATQIQLKEELKKPESEQNQQQIESLKKVLTVKEDEYLTFVYGENALSSYQKQLSKLRNKKKDIPDEMAVVSYFLSNQDLYIIVADKNKVTGKKVKVSKAELDKVIMGLRTQIIFKKKEIKARALDASKEDEYRKTTVTDTLQTEKYNILAEKAYMWLINPIHEEIKDKKTLAIIPTGKLYLLPFQIIGKTLKNGEFSPLIEQFNLFYTNLGDVFDNLEEGENHFKNAKIIVFANPDNTLPNTELEAIAIKKIFPNAATYVKNEATEDKIKAITQANYNAIHFATHGNLDCDNPLESYLTMAKNSRSDGKFKVTELFNLNVLENTRLVVLSACQTAVIDLKTDNHNDPVSPASAFINQNVKSVLASLWSVDDEATSILMASFYNNIKTMPLLQAIRKAQIDLSKNPKYTSPYFWAPFILIGSWK